MKSITIAAVLGVVFLSGCAELEESSVRYRADTSYDEATVTTTVYTSGSLLADVLPTDPARITGEVSFDAATSTFEWRMGEQSGSNPSPTAPTAVDLTDGAYGMWAAITADEQTYGCQCGGCGSLGTCCCIKRF